MKDTLKNTFQHQNATTKVLSIIVALMLVISIICSGIPGLFIQAFFNKEPYQQTQTEIVAHINSDATLLVSEQLSFAFNSPVACLPIHQPNLHDNATQTFDSVRVTELNIEGQTTQTHTLPQIPFDTTWNNASLQNAPTQDMCYTFNPETNWIYLSLNTQAKNIVVSLDYSVSLACLAWRDVAELDWTFVDNERIATCKNIQLTLSLPTPANTRTIPSDNLYVWSHGPKNETLVASEEGIITYQCSECKSSQYANMRTVFPATWLTHIPDVKEAHIHENDMRLAFLKQVESKWVDSASAGQVRGNIIDSLFLVICFVLLALSLILYFTIGKEYPAKITPTSLPKQLIPAEHPAVMGRVWRWNRISSKELIAAIMHLVQEGFIKIVATEDKNIENKDYLLTLTKTGKQLINKKSESVTNNNNAPVPSTNAIETTCNIATLTFLFEDLPKYIPQLATNTQQNAYTLSIDAVASSETEELPVLSLQAIQQAKALHKDAYAEACELWHKEISILIEQLNYFEKPGFRWQIRLLGLAILLLICACGAWATIQSTALLLPAIPTAIMMALIANYLPRRTALGQQRVATLKGLYAYLENEQNKKANNVASPDEIPLHCTCNALTIYRYLLTKDIKKPTNITWCNAILRAFTN